MSELGTNDSRKEDNLEPLRAYLETPPSYTDAIASGDGMIGASLPSSSKSNSPQPDLIQYGTIINGNNFDNLDNGSTTALDPTDQPPSYQSLFGEMQEVRRRSDTVLGFLKNIIVLLLGTIGCTFCVGLVLAIPVSMIVMGSLHLNDCEEEHFIPIYLIVFGVMLVLKNFVSLGKRIKAKCNEDDDAGVRESKFDNLLNFFLFVWFIFGNVWIYKIYKPTPERCDPHLYQFAFWITTSVYILFCMIVSCICCAAICAFGSTESNSNASV